MYRSIVECVKLGPQDVYLEGEPKITMVKLRAEGTGSYPGNDASSKSTESSKTESKEKGYLYLKHV